MKGYEPKVKRILKLTCIFCICVLFFTACSSRTSHINQLFRENFADAPARVSGAPDNVPPSLDEGHLPEIIAACKQSGISSPRFLSDDAPPADGALLQRSAYLKLENGKELRCTYFLYAGKDEVYSRWIEAAESGSDLVSIFPAGTTQESILKEFQ